MIVIKASDNLVIKRGVKISEQQIKLTKKEVALLKALSGNITVTFEELSWTLYKRSKGHNQSGLMNLVSRLRKKGFRIRSSYKYGYQLLDNIYVE